MENGDKHYIENTEASITDGSKRKALKISSEVDFGYVAIFCGERNIIN